MHIATKSDWPDLKPMPASYEDMKIELHFNAAHMHNLRLGFIPSDQNEKWFLYFEDNILHIHRSWTGIKMYEVVFDDDGDGGVARRVRINLGPDYGGTRDDAWNTLLDVLSYYASDEAHQPHESSFVSALKEAAQPNYLGSPSVVMELITPYFWRILCKELPKYCSGLDALPDYEPASFSDVLSANERIASVLSGADESFHGLEAWRTEQGLGKAVIRTLALDPDWYADENLHCILSEGLAGLSTAIAKIIADWANDSSPHNLNALFEFVAVLREFTASVILGTHTLYFPDVTLSDFTWANRSRFMQRDEEAGNCLVPEENPEDFDEVPVDENQQSRFEELLRELEALDAELEEDDALEDEEEILQPGPPVHPHRDDNGNPVKLAHPSTPTALWTWQDPESIAIVIPDGPMPSELAAIPFASWDDAPTDRAGWQRVAEQHPVEEPDFNLPKGKKAAAGVVIVEDDGRVWAVAPSNAYGGYQATFPKGTYSPGTSLQAAAIREAYEEAGLRVQLTRFLVDVPRSTSYTRYYLARRISGHPGDMGWESQAVLLIPADRLPEILTHKNDAPIIKAVQEALS